MIKPIDKWAIPDIESRKITIVNETQSPNRYHRIHEFRNTSTDLPVIRVSIHLPLYRVANYRTNLHQLKYIKNNNKDANFFKHNEENISVQKKQHEFLWDLATTDREKIASIVGRLQAEKQREPLLISSSGIVVNGNRRLAAMRELFFSDPNQYADFGDIDCMVLPSYATEDDFKEIEVRLQMTPETRLPYDWIGECMAVKDLRDNNVEFEVIANWMRMDVSKVKNKLLILKEIELYLKEWRGTEFDYDYLKDAEEIFSQFFKRIKNKEGTQLEIARRIGWILLDQKGNEGRIYDLRDATGTLVNNVVSKIQESYSEEIAAIETNGSAEVELELEFADQNEDQVSEQSILSFLNQCKQDDLAQKDIISFCKAVINERNTQISGESAKISVQDAHTSLLEVDLTSASPETYNAIRKQLEQIENRVQTLKEQLYKLLDAKAK